MKPVVGRIVELIAFLFSLFGGWLKLIAPPEEAEASFAVGLVSVISLLVFLVLTVVIRTKSEHAKICLFVLGLLLAVSGTVSGFIYRAQLRALTFAYPPGSISADYIAGSELTKPAQDYKDQNSGLTNAELLAKFGGLEHRDLVWTAASQRHSATILTWWYVAFVVSVFCSVFCLTEGVLTE